MVDFTLSEAQYKLRAAARAFAGEILSKAEDEYSKFPTQQERFRSTLPLFKQAVGLGQIKGQIPPALGGTGGSMLDVAILLEEMYGADPSLTVTIVGTGLGLTPLIMSGQAELQKKHLQPFLQEEGQPIASLMHSEPGGTANWITKGGKGLQTTAKKEGDHWVINGEKLWTTNSQGWDGRGAELACLVCRQSQDGGPQDPNVDPRENIIVFLVRRETIAANDEDAYKILEEPEIMGHPATCGPRTKLTNFRVPAENVLMEGTAAADLIVASFTPTAALVGIMSVSIARRAFEAALAFAKKDTRSGEKPIIEHQSVADLLINCKIRTDTSRLLCWKALHCLENGPGDFPTRQEICYEAKIHSTDSCVDCVTDAMKVVGMLSYRKDMPFIKLLNDAMCMPLFDGGNIGFRRRQIEKIFQMDNYDPWASFYGPTETTHTNGSHATNGS